MSSETNSIHSEEIQDILGTIPGSVLRWGITVIFSIFLCIIIGSYFFIYPEIVSVPIVITKSNPPVDLNVKSTGKIATWFIKDNDSVFKGQKVALIKNIADYQEVYTLKFFLDTLPAISKELVLQNEVPLLVNLGDIQAYFSQFRSKWISFKTYFEHGLNKEKINYLKNNIQIKNEYNQIIEKQLEYKKQALQLIHNNFIRDSILFVQNGNMIAINEYEKSRQQYISALSDLAGKEAEQKNIYTEVLAMENEIKVLYNLDKETINNYNIELNNIKQQLLISLDSWEEKYLVKSPISGKITFTKYWTENQFISNIGEKIATVVPLEGSQIIGKIKIVSSSLGKVKAGQKVNVKLSGFPFADYGTINGYIEKISLVPGEGGYYADILFKNGLITSYGKQIKFVEEMDGTADIITDNNRLFFRFFNPIKSLLKNKHN